MINSKQIRDCVEKFLLSATFIVSTLGLTTAYYHPPEKGELGVIFPPWFDEADSSRAIIDAGGLLVGSGRFSNIIVAYSQDEGFSDRIIKRGALLIVAAKGLCAPVQELAI